MKKLFCIIDLDFLFLFIVLMIFNLYLNVNALAITNNNVNNTNNSSINKASSFITRHANLNIDEVTNDLGSIVDRKSKNDKDITKLIENILLLNLKQNYEVNKAKASLNNVNDEENNINEDLSSASSTTEITDIDEDEEEEEEEEEANTNPHEKQEQQQQKEPQINSQHLTNTSKNQTDESVYVLNKKHFRCKIISSQSYQCEELVDGKAKIVMSSNSHFLNSTTLHAFQNGFANLDWRENKVFMYFLSAIIFLSSLTLLLIVVIAICCVIYYKQRARLDYYLNENYFTYFNKNAPVIASASSYSITSKTPLALPGISNIKETNKMNVCHINTIDVRDEEEREQEPGGPEPEQEQEQEEITTSSKSDIIEPITQPMFYNQFNRPPNDIETIPEETQSTLSSHNTSRRSNQSFRILNKCKTNFINLKGLVPESGALAKLDSSRNLVKLDTNTTIINVYSSSDDEDLVIDNLSKINTINSNLPRTIPNEAENFRRLTIDRAKCMKLFGTKYLVDEKTKNDLNKTTERNKLSSVLHTELNNSYTTDDSATKCTQVAKITKSPNKARERYYKLLKEQVLPYLQRPNIILPQATPPADTSDVLY